MNISRITRLCTLAILFSLGPNVVVSQNLSISDDTPFIELFSIKSKKDKDWYRVKKLPFDGGMWRHSPKLHPFYRVLIEFATGFQYKYLNETKIFDRVDSIFFSQIDSLNIIDYANDTIYLFQLDGEYLLESRGHKIVKGRHFQDNEWDSVTNVFMSLTPNDEVKIGWLPEYMRQALMCNDKDMINTLCLDYEINESYYFNISNSHGVDVPTPHLIFYKIVLSNGKITERTRFDFEYFDGYEYRQAQLYVLEQEAIHSNRVITKSIFDERAGNSFLSHLLDSLDANSYYSSFLIRNPQLKDWEKRYVLPMIDSVCSLNMHSDTLYYYLEVSNNPLFNVAKFNSNHSRLYLHEVYNDKIIWDTIKYDVEDAILDARINGTQYDQMFKSYTLFFYPMRKSALPYIFNLANHNRWYYDYARNDFSKFHRSRSIWVDSPENAQKCNKIGQGKKIRLFYRIEIKDGKIVNAVNEMLYCY